MNKPASKTSSVVKTLIGNRTVRKVVIRNAKQAITYATTTMAARSAARSGNAESASPRPGEPGKPAAKPASSAFDTAALTTFVSSVAKPVAEKMATTETGRSVLRTLNNISGDALGTAPKRSTNPAAAFITKLAGAAASAGTPGAQAEVTEEAKVRFTPLQPAAAPSSEPIKIVKWPPPKLPAAAGDASQSGTDSVPE